MDIQKMNCASRLREWADMVSECRNSGQTVAAWCAEHGIGEKTYYYRLKRVCAAIPDDKRLAGVPAQCMEPVFAELAPIGQTARGTAAITVRYGNMEIQIHDGAQPATIEATLRAVARIC
jgi:hypothetical protein